MVPGMILRVTNKIVLLTAFSLFYSFSSSLTSAVEIGDAVCVEGYPMDFYCINEGTLVDNPTIKTLDNPAAHSVHCLLDVPKCSETPFEILVLNSDTSSDASKYMRGYRLTNEGKDSLVEFTKSVGDCTECTGEGTVANDFRVGISGTVTALGSDDGVPPMLSVENVFLAAEGDNLCGMVTSVSDVETGSEEEEETKSEAENETETETDISSSSVASLGLYLMFSSLILFARGW